MLGAWPTAPASLMSSSPPEIVLDPSEVRTPPAANGFAGLLISRPDIVNTSVPAGNDCPVEEKASPDRNSAPSVSMNLRWELSIGQTSKLRVPFAPNAVTDV